MNNSKLNIVSSYIFILFSLFSFKCFSQHFIFEPTIGLKCFGSSFQKTTGIITEGGNSTYNYTASKWVNSYENRPGTNKFGLEPELNIAFFELNKKWKINVGISTYRVKSRVDATCTTTSDSAEFWGSNSIVEYIDLKRTLRYQQFSVSMTRTFTKKTKSNILLLNKFSLGLGLNYPFKSNVDSLKNHNFFHPFPNSNHSGVDIQTTFGKTAFFGFLRPLIFFKYEIVFQNKKHPAGLCNFFVTYLQGFSNHFDYTLTSSANGGASLNLKSENNGSGLRFGISKTFAPKKKRGITTK